MTDTQAQISAEIAERHDTERAAVLVLQSRLQFSSGLSCLDHAERPGIMGISASNSAAIASDRTKRDCSTRETAVVLVFCGGDLIRMFASLVCGCSLEVRGADR